MSINTKELCKKIKRAGYRSLIWQVADGAHYVSNRQWVVRFRELPREVLISLFAVFAEIPGEGQTLAITGGTLRQNAKYDFKPIFAGISLASSAQVTPFLRIFDTKLRMRAIRLQSGTAYINEDYMTILSDFEGAQGTGVMAPVFFCGGDVVLMPFRVSGPDESDALLDTLFAEVSA
jgi:hypothetical protein